MLERRTSRLSLATKVVVHESEAPIYHGLMALALVQDTGPDEQAPIVCFACRGHFDARIESICHFKPPF